MTLIIKKISVKGFLGYRDITIPFDEKINFLIGRNGAGKTTFIRLLHACLALDHFDISQQKFSELTISYSDDETGLTPQLKIEKIFSRRPVLRYHFRKSGSERFRTFSDSRGPSDNFFHFSDRTDSLKDVRARERELNTLRAELRSMIRAKINFSWLPLHRVSDMRAASSALDPFDDEEEEEFESPIDRKISDLIGRMTRYFSVLDTRTSRETRLFQEEYFTSLISYKPDSVRYIVNLSKHTDFPKQKSLMKEIFVEMGFSESNILETVDNFYERAKSSAESLNSSEPRLKITDLFAVADTIRLTRIIERFQEYNERKRSIQKPKTDFSELMSETLNNKRIYFDEANQPTIEPVNNITDDISMYDLSSGEKQLFIILCEALLQEGKRFIFIADEPELSLHVDWQENLVRNISLLNENCQIIFATHSPDIVSIYQDRVIDFEKL